MLKLFGSELIPSLIEVVAPTADPADHERLSQLAESVLELQPHPTQPQREVIRTDEFVWWWRSQGLPQGLQGSDGGGATAGGDGTSAGGGGTTAGAGDDGGGGSPPSTADGIAFEAEHEDEVAATPPDDASSGDGRPGEGGCR